MNITVYSTTTCATCHIVTEWLDKQGLSYVKKNTDEDVESMAEFMSLNDGIISVPFTVIENEGQTTKLVGYDIAKLKQATGV